MTTGGARAPLLRRPLRRGRSALLLAAVLLVTAPVPAAGAADDDDGPERLPAQRCEVDDARLVEGSGLGEVPGRDDRLLAHDDGERGARLVVLAADGCRVVAEHALDAEAVDVEDVDVAPDAAGGAVAVLADTGDNRRSRETVALLVVDLPDDVDRPAGPLDVRRVEVVLPDGPADVEALVVDPTARAALLVEKTLLPRARVWAVDLEAADRVRARQVATAEVPGSVPRRPVLQTTAADLAPDGSALVLRTYVDLRVWELGDAGAGSPRGPVGEAFVDGVARALDEGPGVSLVPPSQPQGEAAAWVDDGLLLLSEGRPAPLDLVGGQELVGRAPPEPAPEPSAALDDEVSGSEDQASLSPVERGLLGVAAVALVVLTAVRRRRARSRRPGSR